MNDHLTNEQVQMLVDNALSVSESRAAKSHLHTCETCQARLSDFRRLNRVLGNLPVQHIGAEFTRNVLTTLGIVPKNSVSFRMVEGLAYVFGLMIVLGIMLSAFIFSGVISSERLTETESVIGNATESMTGGMNLMVNALTQGLQTYMPFFFGNENSKMVATGVFVLGVLALLDRILRRHIVR